MPAESVGLALPAPGGFGEVLHRLLVDRTWLRLIPGMHRGSKVHPPETTRNGLNERTSLEQRIAWLERQMVRLLWAAIGGLSLVIGGIAYSVTIGSFGGLGAFGIAIVAWAISIVRRKRNGPHRLLPG